MTDPAQRKARRKLKMPLQQWLPLNNEKWGVVIGSKFWLSQNAVGIAGAKHVVPTRTLLSCNRHSGTCTQIYIAVLNH
jgi:hypothetical protein